MSAAPVQAQPVQRYASWGTRVLGYLIDLAAPFALLLLGAVIGWPHSEVQTRDVGGYSYQIIVQSGYGYAFYIGLLLAVAFWFANKGYLEGKTGKSLGKRVIKCTTVSQLSARPVGPGFGCLRALFLALDTAICYLGLLWPLWDPQRQCLVSDKLTRSVVVRDPRPPARPAADSRDAPGPDRAASEDNS